VKPAAIPPTIDRGIFAKILRDLARLPRTARRLDIEATVWRSVARHARTLSAEQIAEVTWRILRSLAAKTAA
jgi:hypothetical protein